MNQQELELPDPDLITIRFPALRATQPIGDLYLAVMTARDIGTVANFDVRRVLQQERDVERYLGIQRPLNDQRVADLEKYVNFADATFPTSIILSVDDDYAEFDEESNLLMIRNYREGEREPSTNIRRIARVLDGQHRIMGLYSFKGESFQVPVTLFIGMDLSDQAYVFSTVNLEQTKVSRSLTFDLFALAKTRSPQRTCHNIAVALDSDEESPFYRRIKRLGIATPGRLAETITQAAFVLSLQPYISKDPKLDRDKLLRGEQLERAVAEDSRRLIFRNMFIDGRDVDIGSNIFNFFSAVKERWPAAWNTRERGMILNRTNGFRALMAILRPAYLKFGTIGSVVPAERFKREFARVPVDDSHFNTDNYPPGTSGEVALRNNLMNWLELQQM